MLAAYDDRPASKLDTLKKLRILIKHAMKKKWIAGDPSTGIKRAKIGEVRSWTDDEIRQYENRWPIGTKQRTAFALMLFTGQRRSDVHRMTWQDISHTNRAHQGASAKDRHENRGAAASGLARGAGKGAAQSRHHRQHRVRQTVHGGWLLILHARRHQSRRIAARLSAARTAQGSRSPSGGSRMHHEADHGDPWSQVDCGSGAIHERRRSNKTRDGGDVAAGSANRERSLPKPPVSSLGKCRKC